MELKTIEKDFIQRMNAYLENPLSNHGEQKVATMLRDYLTKYSREKVITKIEYKTKYVTAPMNHTRKSISADLILKVVCESTGVPEAEIRQSTRKINIAFARHLFFYFCRLYTYLSLKEIAQKMRGEDHTTVIFAVRKINEYLSVGTPECDLINEINEKLLESIRGEDGTMLLPFGKVPERLKEVV